MIALFYYQDQNALSKCFLVQIYLFSSEETIEAIGKISLKIEATNSVLVLVVKWRHHANGLLTIGSWLACVH